MGHKWISVCEHSIKPCCGSCIEDSNLGYADLLETYVDGDDVPVLVHCCYHSELAERMARRMAYVKNGIKDKK